MRVGEGRPNESEGEREREEGRKREREREREKGERVRESERAAIEKCKYPSLPHLLYPSFSHPVGTHVRKQTDTPETHKTEPLTRSWAPGPLWPRTRNDVCECPRAAAHAYYAGNRVGRAGGAQAA